MSEWYEDRGELVGFLHWYWNRTHNNIGTAREIIDCVEKPWHFDKEYAWYKEDQEEVGA